MTLIVHLHLKITETSETDLVTEAFLNGEVGAVGDHSLTGEDGVNYNLDVWSHVWRHCQLKGHLALIH